MKYLRASLVVFGYWKVLKKGKTNIDKNDFVMSGFAA